MKVKWNRVHFEPEVGRKYLVWWPTTQRGRYAIGEYRNDWYTGGPSWAANGSRKLGKLVEFWAELPDAPSKDD
jgi:hypothetical protein